MFWHVHPDVVLWSALIEAVYLYGLRAVGRPRGLRASPTQVAWFSLGVAVLYLGAGTPIHDIAEQRLFSVHMVQHMLFTLVAPPFLLLGTPDWLVLPVLEQRRLRRVARFLTRPAVAFTLFNLVTAVTHLPDVGDAALRHHWFHFILHVVLLGSALLMWWPVLSPTTLLPRLSEPLQMVYLFLQSFVPTVLASFITFSSTVWYEFYAQAPRLWGISAIEDQRYAGLIMKLGGGAILWLAIGIIFFRWVAREERKERTTATELRWEDVEEELRRMGLTKPPSRRAR